MNRRACCGTLLLLLGCAHSRSASGPFAPIEALEWRRSLGDGQLELLARTDADPAVRARAVRALGRVQHPQSAISIEGALSDSEVRVRSEAAFAAELFGLSWQPLPDENKAALEAALLSAEAKEGDLEVRRRMLDALGRFASPGCIERLLERLTDASLAERAALAVGVAQRQKGKLPDAGYAALQTARDGNDPSVRAAATYALSLTKDARARGALGQSLADGDVNARAWAAEGLGDLFATDAARKLISESALADDAKRLAAVVQQPETWPAIEATRALAKLAKAPGAPGAAALAGLGEIDPSKSAPITLAVAQLGLPEGGRALLQAWRQKLATTTGAERARFVAGNLDCRLAAAIDRLDGAPNHSKGCGLGAVDKGWSLATALKEIAQDPPKSGAERLELAKAALDNPDSRVRMAAVELLGSSNVVEARPIARKLLDDKDLILAAAAAGALATLKDEDSLSALMLLAARAKEKVDIAPAVADALASFGLPVVAPILEEWLTSPDATVRHTAAAALSTLTKVTVRAGEVERAAAPEPAPVARQVRVLLKTTAGDIELTLDGQAAPITVGNFVALARSGYLKGVSFHRIVPGFVAQGGDPRGDGEGGPGYTIPCEATDVRYERGTVGMALGGKDTGGSQFFLTLTRQPHLEGRYTAFGRVSRGLEVADALLEGDTISSVELLD